MREKKLRHNAKESIVTCHLKKRRKGNLVPEMYNVGKKMVSLVHAQVLSCTYAKKI